jgi:hypothetical protein
MSQSHSILIIIYITKEIQLIIVSIKKHKHMPHDKHAVCEIVRQKKAPA